MPRMLLNAFVTDVCDRPSFANTSEADIPCLAFRCMYTSASASHAGSTGAVSDEALATTLVGGICFTSMRCGMPFSIMSASVSAAVWPIFRVFGSMLESIGLAVPHIMMSLSSPRTATSRGTFIPAERQMPFICHARRSLGQNTATGLGSEISHFSSCFASLGGIMMSLM